jgi:hypothetical protein
MHCTLDSKFSGLLFASFSSDFQNPRLIFQTIFAAHDAMLLPAGLLTSITAKLTSCTKPAPDRE